MFQLLVSNDLTRSLYLDSMYFLIQNLPDVEMKRVASALIERDNREKLVSCLDGKKVIGAAFGGLIGENMAYLEFFLVLPEYRKQKIGESMLGLFETKQLENNVSIIELDTCDKNVSNWFKSRGYNVVLSGPRYISQRKELVK